MRARARNWWRRRDEVDPGCGDRDRHRALRCLADARHAPPRRDSRLSAGRSRAGRGGAGAQRVRHRRGGSDGRLLLYVSDIDFFGRSELRGAGDGRQFRDRDFCGQVLSQGAGGVAALDRRGAGRLRRGAPGTVIYVLLAFGAAAAAYQLLALAAALRQALKRETRGAFRPPVSILKPLHGLDPDFYRTVRSHALLDYPQFEILFGVNDADDPAIGEIE